MKAPSDAKVHSEHALLNRCEIKLQSVNESMLYNTHVDYFAAADLVPLILLDNDD
jgi:hypothetical protein